ncbi:MAG TPA: hypothetical protein VHZ81_04645 [Galbitalea sp.]|jgi:hypothetical protein|nr:hypothetical protein [Galbitalea sp.]
MAGLYPSEGNSSRNSEYYLLVAAVVEWAIRPVAERAGCRTETAFP